MSSSSVTNWYAHKNIFITGGGGFVGLCLLEKLLRSITDIGDVYLLLRPKRGKSIDERLESIKKNAIFEKLLETTAFEKAFVRVKVVAGDIAQPNLGLSPEDHLLLTQNVNVIFHSAATLDFTDSLKTTVEVNLLGTRRVLELGRECRRLAAFIHVSSAYVNSFQFQADEVLYPLKADTDEIVALVQNLPENELNAKTVEILADHPNTYTFTKHMAEHEVQKMERAFPCTIVRPSMIIGVWKEPIPGWTCSKNGPQGFLMGASKGVIRRLPIGKDLIYDYIPVDIVTNTLIAAGFYTGSRNSKTVEVFHCTSSTRNPFRWVTVADKLNTYLHKFPLKSAIWYPHLKLLPSVTWFRISVFFVHILPAIILDGVAKIAGGRPILLRLHRRVNASLSRLEKFIFCEFTFTADNTEMLQKWLSAEDQVMFNVNVSRLVWTQYIEDLAIGARVYLNNEKMSNIDAARHKQKLLMVLHLLLQSAIYILMWYLFACIFNTSMWKSTFVIPIFYMLFSLL